MLGDLTGINTLRGEHNAQNAAFALAAVSVWRFPPESLQRGLTSYPGLPHRLEEVGRSGRMLFINDSKATNADATARALVCFDNISWIVGGRAKEGGIESLLPLLPHVRKAYLIGESSGDFSRTLHGPGSPCKQLRHPRCRAQSGPPPTPPRAAECGGAAVASLRVLRSIRQFRSARRCVPRTCFHPDCAPSQPLEQE